MKKRISSLILGICLLLTQLPTVVLAEEEGPAQEAAASMDAAEEATLFSDGESDPEPTAQAEAQARYQSAEGGDWVVGSLSEAIANVYSGGRVEVLEDVVLDAPLSIRKELTLTSAEADFPCTITYTTQTRAAFGLTIYANATLTHIVLDGGRMEGLTTHAELVGVQGGSTLTLGEGALIQNNDNVDTAESAGGLRVVSGTVVMEAGSAIRNCRGVVGGGATVTSSGLLELNGGVIEDCQAFVGGGVYLPQRGGDIKIHAGAIRGNEARKTLEGMSYNFKNPSAGNGGGIAVNQGRVYFLGGDLSENYAQSGGGGIYVNNGLLQLANGSITANEAGGYGGGIYASPDTYMAVGNSPQVVGNTGGNRDEGVFDNLYMDGAEDYGGPATRPMTVGAALGDKASISVARWLRPDNDHSYRVVAVPNAGKYTITESDLDKFFSDDPAYITLLHEGDVVLATAHVVFDSQGHGTAPKGQHLSEDRKAGEPEAPSELGYDFGGWYREPECETAWVFEADTVLETQEEPLTLYAKWTPTLYSISYQLNGGEDTTGNPADYTIESEDITLASPEKEGHTFLGWTTGEEKTPQEDQVISHGSTGDRVYTAHWALDTYPVAFDVQGHGIAPEEQNIGWGNKADQPDEPTASGWRFDGWYKETACEIPWDFDTDTVTGPVTLYAKWVEQQFSPARPNRPVSPEQNDLGEGDDVPLAPPPPLETADHFAYIVGFSDGTVRPEANITRAEVAAIFFRLMREDYRTQHSSAAVPFSDVAPDAWYRRAAATCAAGGLIKGRGDGTFDGGQDTTRAEFAVIAARFLGGDAASHSGFPDLEGHWADGEISKAVTAGWIEGYDDGLFHPDDPISRAQVMTLVNRMLSRVPDLEKMHPDMRVWPDNPATAWYYADVQEATNGHTYQRQDDNGPETWIELTENRDWTELER